MRYEPEPSHPIGCKVQLALCAAARKHATKRRTLSRSVDGYGQPSELEVVTLRSGRIHEASDLVAELRDHLPAVGDALGVNSQPVDGPAVVLDLLGLIEVDRPGRVLDIDDVR